MKSILTFMLLALLNFGCSQTETTFEVHLEKVIVNKNVFHEDKKDLTTDFSVRKELGTLQFDDKKILITYDSGPSFDPSFELKFLDQNNRPLNNHPPFIVSGETLSFNSSQKMILVKARTNEFFTKIKKYRLNENHVFEDLTHSFFPVHLNSMMLTDCPLYKNMALQGHSITVPKGSALKVLINYDGHKFMVESSDQIIYFAQGHHPVSGENCFQGLEYQGD